MDPLTALSLAGNVVQFIQFGAQIVSLGQEIRESASGASIENADIEATTRDFQSLSRKIKELSSHGRTLSPCSEDEAALLDVCDKSITISDELLAYLNKLKVGGQEQRRWRSYRQALKSVWKKEGIDSFTERLSGLRRQIDSHILLSLKMHQNFDSLQQDARVNSLQTTINELISMLFGTHIKRVESSLLDSLKFPAMTERYEEISEAHRNTFQWILQAPKPQRPWPSFVDWLSSGHGLYWVCGKPASGKSTLMRYIYNNSKTWDLLQQWSHGHTLVHAGFFFWNSGTIDQRSHKGLLFSLLYQTLDAHRELIPLVFPSRWQRTYLALSGSPQLGDSSASPWPLPSAWSLKDLKEAFNLLTRDKTLTTKICFFIDGLDEYDGDYAEMAQLFSEAAKSPNIKICISSRPLVVFEDEFEGCPSLRLQDLTHDDITNYVSDRLCKSRKWNKLVQLDPSSAFSLVQEIVDAADGVFLWVKLVVTSLLSGIGNRDEIADLQKRLRLLPSDLEKLYLHMITKIEPDFYLDQASQIFQIVRQDREILAISTLPRNLQPEPISIARLWLAYDESLQRFAIEEELTLGPREIFLGSQRMSDRLRTRCAGLLELSEILVEREFIDADATFISKRVVYMHRTARDFLERPEIWGMILKRTALNDFQPRVRLLNACIIGLKIQVNNSAKGQRQKLTKPMWTNIFHAVLCAYLEDIDRGESHEAELDELNRVAGAGQISRAHWSESSPLQFVSPMVLIARQDTFFSFAVQFGLYSYLQCKVRKGLGSLNKKGLDLLEYAILPTPSGMQYSTRISIIELLLRCNTGREEINRYRTTWEIAVHYAQESLNEENEMGRVEEWLEILILFVRHGIYSKEWEGCYLLPISVWAFIDDLAVRSSDSKVETLRHLLAEPVTRGHIDSNAAVGITTILRTAELRTIPDSEFAEPGTFQLNPIRRSHTISSGLNLFAVSQTPNTR